MIHFPKVAVVILNWNGLSFLQQFLPGVVSSTYPNLQIIVGDNASTDGSVTFLRSRYPEITVIANEENYGFTGGYNRVLAQVEADYFILLNSDVEVAGSWIEPVVELMESDESIAAAAPKVRAYNNRNFFEHAGAAGGFIDKLGYPFCRGRIFYEVEEDKGQYDITGEIFWATGAALFIKASCWRLSGGFDERFFAHMEEIDLCWRLKNMGYKIMYCAQSTVYHVGGGTLNAENPFKTYLNFRNNLFLLKNNLPFGRSVIIISVRFWLDLLALIRFVSEGKRKDAGAVSRAHRSFIRNLFRKDKGVIVEQGQKKKEFSHEQSKHNLKGLYNRSIAADFFLKKKTRFTGLDPQDFC